MSDSNKISLLGDEANKEIAKVEDKKPQGTLELILKSLQAQDRQSIERVAFEVDPNTNNVSGSFANLYRPKTGLTPDEILKRITGPQGDELVCQIIQARMQIISSFGRPRSSRFSVGFEFQPLDKLKIDKTPEGLKREQELINQMKEFIWNCGYELDDEYFSPNFSQFLKMIVRDGVTFGRCAIERVFKYNVETGKEEFCAFRPVDAGTIYRIAPHSEKDQSARMDALRILSELKNEKFDTSKYKKDEYKWCQVINGKPVQAFTDDELIVYNFYPTTNIDYNGYPLTPIDQALSAITTHVSITMYNKLYFQHGRASKGILIVKSDDIDDPTLKKMRAQFHAQINSVENAHRMPVFGVGSKDDIIWQNIDISNKDAEFQYLSDNNARVILSAFQMSPEELPGYAHLARGTNSNALAESQNEWKLTAARDVGLRPLIFDVQDLLNTHLMPFINKDFSKKYQLVLAGLEQDDPEKEATRLGQDINLHMTINEMLEKVEKDPLPHSLGGDMILNQQYHSLVLQPYLTVGQILESFFGVEGASQNPRLDYYRDPFYMQNQQMMIQKAQLALQQQMQNQQMMMQQQQQAMAQQQGGEQPQEDQEEQQGEVQKSEVVNYDLLSKAAEHNSNKITNYLLKRHKQLTDHHIKTWEDESKKTLNDILKEVKDNKKAK